MLLALSVKNWIKKLKYPLRKKAPFSYLFFSSTYVKRWVGCLVCGVYFDPHNHPGRKPCRSLFPDSEKGQRGENSCPKLCNWLQSLSESQLFFFFFSFPGAVIIKKPWKQGLLKGLPLPTAQRGAGGITQSSPAVREEELKAGLECKAHVSSLAILHP